MKLMILDENGSEIKEKRSILKSYTLGTNENCINLKISYANGVVHTLSNILSVFSDGDCIVIKFRNETYVISKN